MNKIITVLKNPTTWVIVVTTLLAATAFSALRKPFIMIAKKIPGSDLVGN